MKRRWISAAVFGLVMLVCGLVIGSYADGGNPTVGGEGAYNLPWFNATKGFGLGLLDVTPYILNANPAGDATFGTVDTGQGAYDLWGMDQNLSLIHISSPRDRS